MHMAGCTCGDPLQPMMTSHYARYDVTKIMTCIMKNGRLQYDFVRDLSLHMRNLSSHHRIAEKVADDHQV